jgi:hypothetical protein
MTFEELKNLKEGDKVKVLDNPYYKDPFFRYKKKFLDETQKMVSQICEVKEFDDILGLVSVWQLDKKDFWYFCPCDLELVEENK